MRPAAQAATAQLARGLGRAYHALNQHIPAEGHHGDIEQSGT
jgi:hypothetical protein